MNGFEKNKNGTTKRNVKSDASNDQLGENANNEYRPENYPNVEKPNKKGK